ncbi:27126_t:CDS:2, partial [Dentiscutata erythropus]
MSNSSISEKKDLFNSTENSEGSENMEDIEYSDEVDEIDEMEDIEIEGVEEMNNVEYIEIKEKAENMIASTSRISVNSISRVNNSAQLPFSFIKYPLVYEILNVYDPRYVLPS